ATATRASAATRAAALTAPASASPKISVLTIAHQTTLTPPSPLRREVIDLPRPRRGSTAARHSISLAPGGGEGRVRGEYGRTTRAHDPAVTTGFCQPPGGVTLCSTSFGPQVPGSYSYTGVPACSTGSTMRHASSTLSSR